MSLGRHDAEHVHRSSIIGRRLDFFKTSDFIVDSTGDPDNLRYGRMSSSDVSRYQLRGLGRVIGLPDAYRIARDRHRSDSSGKGLEIVLKAGESSRKAGEEPLRVRTLNSARRLRPRAKAEGIRDLVDADYVLVSRATRLRHHAEEEEELPVYRSIVRKEQAAASDAESDGSDEDDELFESPEDALRQRIIECECQTRAEPTDVHAWMELARLQRGRSGGKSAGSKRAEAEVVLDLLEDALKAHPSNKLSIELQRAAMDAFAQVKSPADVSKRWQSRLDMLEERAADLDERDLMAFWFDYIEWRESTGLRPRDDKGEGGVDEVLQIYADCIARSLSRPRTAGKGEHPQIRRSRSVLN